MGRAKRGSVQPLHVFFRIIQKIIEPLYLHFILVLLLLLLEDAHYTQLH